MINITNPTQIQLARAASIKACLGMMKAGLKHSRISNGRMLELASEFTGVKYKRGEYEKAREDLQIWINKQTGHC